MGNCSDTISPINSPRSVDIPENEVQMKPVIFHIDGLDKIMLVLGGLGDTSDPIIRKKLLSSLWDLYKIYVSRCTTMKVSYHNIMDIKDFFVYFVVILAEKQVTIVNAPLSLIAKTIIEMTTPGTSYISISVDGIKDSIIKILKENFGLLAQEHELFGSDIAHQVRINSPDNNVHRLNKTTRPKWTEEQYTIDGIALYNALASNLSDSRCLSLDNFYKTLKSASNSTTTSTATTPKPKE